MYTRKKTKHFFLSYKLLYTFTDYKLEQRKAFQHGFIRTAYINWGKYQMLFVI